MPRAGSPPAEAGGFIGEEDAIANHRRVNAAVSAGGPARRPAGLWPARTRRIRRLEAAEPPSIHTMQSFFSSFPSGNILEAPPRERLPVPLDAGGVRRAVRSGANLLRRDLELKAALGFGRASAERAHELARGR